VSRSRILEPLFILQKVNFHVFCSDRGPIEKGIASNFLARCLSLALEKILFAFISVVFYHFHANERKKPKEKVTIILLQSDLTKAYIA
jgi:hypothetical protein